MALKRKFVKRILRFKFSKVLLRRAVDVYDEISFEKHKNLGTRSKVETFLSLLEPKSSYDLTRYGDEGDGGYLLANCIKDSSCVLSIGVGENTSFDKAILKMVAKVIMVDYSVDFWPQRSEMSFIKKKLVSYVQDNSTEISLPALCSSLPSETPLILKMDIEGTEWKILSSLDQAFLLKFDQIVIELHRILQMSKNGQLQFAIEIISRILQDFEVINSHANNYSSYEIFLNIPIVDVVEVTLLRKDLIESVKVQDDVRDVNFPNNPDKPEVFLTFPRT